MKIILTGSCGFVGSNVANRLIGDNNVSLWIDDLSFGNKFNLENDDRLIKERFENLSEDFLSLFDVLIHCATSNIIYAMDHPIETFQNNATNTIKLFQKFKGKIIYTSTASVYGQAQELPTTEDAPILTNNAYDQSKYIAELFLQQRGNYTTLRLSNIYGPNQRPDNPYCGVVGKLIYNINKDFPIYINGDGEQTRDYTYIDDVVDAIIIALQKEALNTEINIATGVETSINKLIEHISLLTSKSAEVQNIEKRKIDGINSRCLSIEKAELLLGWKPKHDLQSGLHKTIEWTNSLKQ